VKFPELSLEGVHVGERLASAQNRGWSVVELPVTVFVPPTKPFFLWCATRRKVPGNISSGDSSTAKTWLKLFV